MIGGNRPTGDVTVPNSTVTLGGTPRAVESVSVTRELATDLPEQVVGASGLTAATGEVQWGPRTPLARSADTPWATVAGTPPTTGQAVTVDFGVDDQQWRILSGLVDSSSGALADGTARSTLVDYTDTLRRRITAPPLLAMMPPTSRLVPATVKAAGLSAVSIVDRLARACGYAATPRPRPGSMFSVSLLGDLHPDLGGELHTCPTKLPSYSLAAWGPVVERTDSVSWVLTDHRFGPAGTGFDLTTQVDPNDRRTGSITVSADGVDVVRLLITATEVTFSARTVDASYRGQTVKRRDFSRATARLVEHDAAARVELWLDGALVASAEYTLPALSTNTSGEWRITVAGALPFGSVVVDPPAEGQPVAMADVANMVWDIDTLEPLAASPARVRVEALTLMREAAAALCASMWLDELGRLHWTSRGRLTAHAPALDLTSAESLVDLEWESSSSALRREVAVAWRRPAVVAQGRPGVTLWQAGEIVTDHAPTLELFIHPDGDEDWIGVDTIVKFPSGTPAISPADLVAGVGTWAYTSVLEGGYGRVFADLMELDPQSWSFTAHNEVDPSRVGWQTPDDFPAEQYRLQQTPYVRGTGRVQWSDVVTTSDLRGPETAADFGHEAGVWVQTEDRARALADWIGAACVDPDPRIGSLTIIPDPRIQLGDVVRILDRDVAHVDLVGVVVGVHLEHRGVELSQSLTVRVMTATAQGVLLGDHDDAWRGADLSELDAMWTPADLGDLDRNPLRTV